MIPVVYVVMLNDRHTDIKPVRVFYDGRAAILFAKEYIRTWQGDESQIDESFTPEGWLYYGVYSGEGDCVYVVPTGLET